MDVENDYQRVLRELQEIEQAIEELTPLRSRWNGTLRLETLRGERGGKSFSCDIKLRPHLAVSPMRWRTLIHEMFHACSAGFQIYDFNANLGWEEGVVEQLSRLYRAPVLERLDVEVDLNTLAVSDEDHPFNKYIAALETIRVEMEAHPVNFYIDLLMTPIRERYSSLLQKALRLETVQRKSVIAALSAARPVLERSIP